jgi:hypothetical protein
MSKLKEKFGAQIKEGAIVKNDVYINKVSVSETGRVVANLFMVFDKPYESKTRTTSRGNLGTAGSDLSATTADIMNFKTATISYAAGTETADALLALPNEGAGVNFNDLLEDLGKDLLTINVWEVTSSEFEALTEGEKALFLKGKTVAELEAKINPETNKKLLFKGEQIFSASILEVLNDGIEDIFVKHDAEQEVGAQVVKRVATRERAKARA